MRVDLSGGVAYNTMMASFEEMKLLEEVKDLKRDNHLLNCEVKDLRRIADRIAIHRDLFYAVGFVSCVAILACFYVISVWSKSKGC